jgi:hypothetical protein
VRDGQHDFDFHLGSWTTSLRRLLRPLSGSDEWAEYEGTTMVRPVWGGLANLVELDVIGAPGRLQVLSLRLYNPETGQWSLNSASSRGGAISVPSIGAFEDGRGDFFADESFGDRAIVSRFSIFEITPVSCRFEQSFSDDAGKKWELNWAAIDTRAIEPGR